jgi:hypothetical protein
LYFLIHFYTSKSNENFTATLTGAILNVLSFLAIHLQKNKSSHFAYLFYKSFGVILWQISINLLIFLKLTPPLPTLSGDGSNSFSPHGLPI